MKRNKYILMAAVGVLILAALACSFSASTAKINRAWMAKDQDGKQETTVFAQGDVFYMIVDLANAPDDTAVKAVWTAVEIDTGESNVNLGEKELTSGSGQLYFQLSNQNLWPTGKYKVDVYLNGELNQTLNFEVQ